MSPTVTHHCDEGWVNYATCFHNRRILMRRMFPLETP